MPATKLDSQSRFIELRAAGQSYDSIARELGVAKGTLISWSRELTREIENARAMALDELLQKYATSKAVRIECLGKRLKSIMAELDSRDLSKVDTGTLLRLALQYAESLRNDESKLPLKPTIDDGCSGDDGWTA